jgi:hypothetical protein
MSTAVRSSGIEGSQNFAGSSNERGDTQEEEGQSVIASALGIAF